MRAWKRIIPACILLSFVSVLLIRASFVDVYLAQTAAGSADGSSCANAKAYTFFNSSGNWGGGAGQIGPDTTVHICGTLSSALTFQGSGTSGHPVTLKFETGAKMSAPTWGNNGVAISLPNGLSWIVIDGGTPCGFIARAQVACNGLIEATNNGTSRATQDDDAGIFGRYVSNVTVKNMAVSNLYVKTGNGVDGGGDSIHVDGTNISLLNNVVHDAAIGVMSGRNGSTTSANLVIANNSVYHCNWDYRMVDNGAGGVLNGALVHDNEGYDWQNWDDLVNNNFHHNGLIADLNNSGSVVTGFQFYSNYFHGDVGVHMTGELFVDCNDNSAGCFPGFLVFNNVFVAGAGGNGPSNGLVTVGGYPFAGSVYSNTMYFTAVVGSRCIQFLNVLLTVRNNIMYQCGTSEFDQGGSLVASDYNDFFGQTNIGPSTNPADHPTLTSWQSTGFDAHSISLTPGINTTTFVPTSGASAVVGVADNLTNLGVPALNLDAAGVTRPGGSTAWDIGAFQFAGAAPGPYTVTVQSTNPPTAVAITATTDINGAGNGNSTFARVYNSGASPAFTAPATAGGNAFASFTCPGGTVVGRTCTMGSLAGSSTIVANYAVTPPVTLVVNSTNPGGGVTVVCTGITGTTSFARNYTVGSPVTCTAPPTVGVNTFTGWGNCPAAVGQDCPFAAIAADTTITANYAIPPPATGCQAANASFTNTPLATQSGSFTVTYDDTPSQLNMDGVLGFSNGVAAAYADLAVITRFNASGFVDAYNQAVMGYAAVNSFPYLANVSYHFRLVVDTVAGTYDGYVTAPGGAETQIASGYTFRTGPETLNNWAVTSEVGSHTACTLGIQSPATHRPGAPVLIIGGIQ